jgi:hypothetical protein
MDRPVTLSGLQGIRETSLTSLTFMWAAAAFGIALLITILVLIALVFARGSGRKKSSHHHTRRFTPPVYAVLSNQAAAPTAGPLLWAASLASSISTGISLNTTSGAVTLPLGTFLVQYSVRFQRSPFDGTAVSTTQLQQTVNNTLTNISQPAIVSETSIDGITDAVPSTSVLISGNAVVSVTSVFNNQIALYVTPSTDNSPLVATGTDANAQLTITQLSAPKF